jgi:hypothetical protein
VDHFPGPGEDKANGPATRWLVRLAELVSQRLLAAGYIARWTHSVGERLFGEADERARRRGWQVHVRHNGLSRTYRDPRFDSLQSCPACQGTRTGEQDHPCDRCSGTGRIRLGDRLSPDGRRGR